MQTSRPARIYEPLICCKAMRHTILVVNISQAQIEIWINKALFDIASKHHTWNFFVVSSRVGYWHMK